MTLFKGCHYPKDVIMQAVRWYVAYPLRYRHVEELLEERGIFLDHATVNRWVIKFSLSLKNVFHPHKKHVLRRWRMDETSIKVKGQWFYDDRALDSHGNTVDFYLCER